MKENEAIILELETEISKLKKLEEDIRDRIKGCIFESYSIRNGFLLQDIIFSSSEDLALKIISHSSINFLNKICPLGYTVLHAAVSTHSYRVAITLLDILKQDTIDRADFTGKTALHCAANTNNFKIIPLLVQKMTTTAIIKSDHEGKIALHEAAYNNSFEVIKSILVLPNFYQWVIDSPDKDGNTALSYAIDRKKISSSDLLISKMSIVGLVSTSNNDSNYPKNYNFMRKILIKYIVKLALDPNNADYYLVKSNLLIALTYHSNFTEQNNHTNKFQHHCSEKQINNYQNTTINLILENMQSDNNTNINILQNNDLLTNISHINENLTSIPEEMNSMITGDNSNYF